MEALRRWHRRIFDYGFICKYLEIIRNIYCDSFIFTVFIVGFLATRLGDPRIFWSLNRNNPINENSTFELSPEGCLSLRDENGILVWSSDHSDSSVPVAAISMLDTGNLILDKDNETILAIFWSSLIRSSSSWNAAGCRTKTCSWRMDGRHTLHVVHLWCC